MLITRNSFLNLIEYINSILAFEVLFLITDSHYSRRLL